MTLDLNSLLAKVDDVIDRMPESFNTYELAQRLSALHPADYFAAGNALAQDTPKGALNALHQSIAERLAHSERVIEGAHLPCTTPWGERSSSPRWHRKH
ncbi:hypothetical protein SAMN05880558_10659 [Aeromonas sp. RU39B]|uniref:hypothetical protein n=1 Tax=Aeromonas sp. RU39B TaxID=1907416 RepID=UPI000954EBCE|nr:hypothetical protein [Aeromonas sp. RU39B]SIQ83556.1 hypothetical protein SAMN05880558_10659 [Aeromonas sp. RU39B]